MLLGYLALGARFAGMTPRWQAPDEPAHYNYISQIVETARLPVLETGDYPYARLEELKAAGFPDSETIGGIEYEDYQPPAYYVLSAAAVLLLSEFEADRLLWPRLFSVMLGALTVTLAWAVARRAVPDDGVLAVAAAGFVAFLPMHLVMNASANNDPLAYVILGAILYTALARASLRLPKRRFVVIAAFLYACALVTKVSLYPAALLLFAAEVTAAWHAARFPAGAVAGETTGESAVTLDPDRVRGSALVRGALRGSAACLAGAVAASPWFIRNARVYGWSDPLGIARHNALVVEQPRTAAWIAEHGVADWLLRYVTFTHNSFWGVFGWLAVFLDRRIYAALAVVSVFVALGAIVYVFRTTSACRAGDRRPCIAVGLLGLTTLLSLAVYLAYNLTYVQHQGRYLFTALIPLAVFYQLGLRELVRVAARAFPGFRGTRWLEIIVLAGFVIGLAGLSWLGLTRYVVPGLS